MREGVFIPSEIWNDSRLKKAEIILLVIILKEIKKVGMCSYSNIELAKRMKLSMRTISNYIKHLCELNYIYISTFDGRTRTLNSAWKSRINEEL